jgi:hypothetical protein
METAEEFLKERIDFLRIDVVQDPARKGWDILLRIDGSYSGQELALECADSMANWIENIEGIEALPQEPQWIRGRRKIHDRRRVLRQQ